MGNLSIKIDLLKLNNATIVDIKGKTATKKCVVIPIEDAGLFLGEKGLYLSATGVQLREPKYEQSHFIRAEIDKDKYNAMTEEERKTIPIIGSIKTYASPAVATAEAVTFSNEYMSVDETDLPF